jgi:serine/threonine protein phosphatase PrpC
MSRHCLHKSSKSRRNIIVKYDMAVMSDIGKVRRVNQDNFYVAQRWFDSELGNRAAYYLPTKERKDFLIGVFDGMGGEMFGEVASQLASTTFKEFANRQSIEITAKNVFEELIEFCDDANMKICEEANLRGERMGTTAAVGCILDDWLYLCNVGDSRIYLMRENVLKQLTEDHTEATMLSKAGIVFKGKKGRLIQYLGVKPSEMKIEPFIGKLQMLPGDKLLFCSDGVSDYLSDSEIVSIMQSFDTVEIVSGLVNQALEHGGIDNITSIVVGFKI